jgi:hypothetical protein
VVAGVTLVTCRPQNFGPDLSFPGLQSVNPNGQFIRHRNRPNPGFSPGGDLMVPFGNIFGARKTRYISIILTHSHVKTFTFTAFGLGPILGPVVSSDPSKSPVSTSPNQNGGTGSGNAAGAGTGS